MATLQAQGSTAAARAEVTKYYAFGGQRVAMRQANNEVFFLVGDHLGSASLVVDWQGRKISEMRYAPWGESRWTWELDTGGSYSDRKYTSQREETASYVGLLYDYGARFYLPYAARFVSPDSIVPNARNPMDFNRYTYVRSNPLKYADSSGHVLDTLFDIVAVGVSAVEVYNNPSDPWNWAALAIDMTAAVIPFVPAGAGLVIRAARVAGKAEKVITVAEFVSKSKKVIEGVNFVADIVQDVSQDVQVERMLAEAEGEGDKFNVLESIRGNATSAVFNSLVKTGAKKFGGEGLGVISEAVIGGLSNLGSSALWTAYDGKFSNNPEIPHRGFASASGSVFGTIADGVAQPYGIGSMTRSLGRAGKVIGAFGSFALTKLSSRPKPVNLDFEKRQ